MKKMIKKGWILGFLMFTLWFAMGNAVKAEEKTYQGFEYRIVLQTRYRGDEDYRMDGDEEEELDEEPVEEELGDGLRIKKYLVITKYVGTETEVVIPDVIDGLPVAYIDDSAFAYNKTIKKVTIPNTIEELNYGIFSNCSNLEEVHLGDLETVPALAFANCKKLKRVYGNPKFYGSMAFLNCTSLQKVSIPNGEAPKCVNIGSNAFAGCKNLREMTVYGAEVTSDGMATYNGNVDSSAFYGCKKLKKFEVLGAQMFVSYKAFYGCTSLEKVIGIKTIGQDAFYGCKKLKEIELGNLDGNYDILTKNALRNANPKVKLRVMKKDKKLLQKYLTKKNGYKKTMKIVVSDNKKKNTK